MQILVVRSLHLGKRAAARLQAGKRRNWRWRKHQLMFLDVLLPKTRPICVCVCVHSGMRQGNDVGTTYRSAIYTYTQEQLEEALASRDEFQKV